LEISDDVYEDDGHPGEHPPVRVFRQMQASMLGVPWGSFAGGTQSVAAGGGHGVVGATDLAVAQHTTPNVSVDVSGGSCLITGTQSQNQRTYPNIRMGR
jgi:hypothetical protein